LTAVALQLEEAVTTPAVPEVADNASSGAIVRNALLSYVASAVAMLTGFVVTPVLIRTLGSDYFGLWVLLGSVVGYTGLIELGLSTATAKRVAECRAVGDRERLERILGTAAVLFAMVALVALLATGALAVVMDHLFRLPPESVRSARACMLILGLNQAVMFLFIVQSAILFGSGRLDLMTGAGIALTLGSAVCNVVLVLSGAGIVALALTTLAGGVLGGVIMHWVIRRRLPDVRIRPRLANWKTARELLKYGSRNSVVAICGAIAFGADSLVIGFLLPVANVAHYAVASKLINLVRTLATKPIDVLMPAYSHSYALGEKDRLFKLFTSSVTLPLAIALPFVIAMCANGQGLIRLWVGPGHEASYAILLALGIGLILQLSGYASFTILTGTERNHYLLKTSLFAAPCNLILSILFTLRFGPIGVALGTLVTVAIIDAMLLPYLVCRQFEFCFRTYVRQAILPLVVPTTVAIGVAVILNTIPGFQAGFLPLAAAGITASSFMAIWICTASGARVRHLLFGGAISTYRVLAAIGTT
jgi:O-antigen/teichoic acid export membrane protein